MKNVIVYGADWCADCRRVKAILDEHSIPYIYKNVEEDKMAVEEMLSKTGNKYLIPTLDIDGLICQNPSNTELLELLQVSSTNVRTHDVVMIGAGPAALSAAIYTTREDLDTVLIEKGAIGGLAAITDWIDNYPGFAEGLSGLDLADSLQRQAERFGAKIELNEVTGILDGDMYRCIQTVDGDIYARAVLIATGSEYKKLGIPGENEYYGRGVHFCATCDGAFYRGKKLVVVGGGNSAVQEAMFLTKFATKIDMLVRGEALRASEVLQHEIEKYKDKITIHFNTTTDEIIATDNKVTSVIGTDVKAGTKKVFDTDGIFIFVGLKPNTDFIVNSPIELDEMNFIKTNENLATSMEGVFAAGDVRSGATMQIASASGEGATAALKIREYLKEHSTSTLQA